MDSSDSHLTRRLLGAASLMMAMFARDLFAQTTGERAEDQSAGEKPTQTASAVPPTDGPGAGAPDGERGEP